MSTKKIVVLFVLFFIVFTLFKVPASLVAGQVTLPKGVAYQGLSGTLWQGKISRLQADKWLIQDLEWQFTPGNLFVGKAAFDVKFGNPRSASQLSGKGNVFIGLSGAGMTNAVLRAPAAPIKSMMPIPMGDLGGRIILSVSDYIKGDTFCEQLDGDLTWTKAELDVGSIIEFGAIESALSCVDQSVVASFDGNNSLGLEGTATVVSEDDYSFDVFLKPDSSLPTMVHSSVSSFLGKADSKGRYAFKFPAR